MNISDNFVQMIKEIALSSIINTDPVNILLGKVIRKEPLQIQIDQKQILTDEFLILTNNVKDYETYANIEITQDGEIQINNTEKTDLNTFKVNKVKLKLLNSLKVDDDVILLKQQGGQNYIVLDKI